MGVFRNSLIAVYTLHPISLLAHPFCDRFALSLLSGMGGKRLLGELGQRSYIDGPTHEIAKFFSFLPVHLAKQDRLASVPP